MINKKSLILIFVIFLFIIPFILSGCQEGQVDINTASLEELDGIIWVGPVTAQNIVNERPFSSVDDLINVYGIGEVKLQDIKDQGLACVISNEEETNSTQETETYENEESDDDNDEEDSESEIIHIVQSTKEEKEIKNNTVLETINLNTKENTKKLDKSDYALYGLGIFSLIIIILFLLRKNKFKNEFR